MGNVYIIFKQIYSGNGVSNIVRIARDLEKLLQNISLFISGHTRPTMLLLLRAVMVFRVC